MMLNGRLSEHNKVTYIFRSWSLEKAVISFSNFTDAISLRSCLQGNGRRYFKGLKLPDLFETHWQ